MAGGHSMKDDNQTDTNGWDYDVSKNYNEALFHLNQQRHPPNKNKRSLF
jgi:hypothetical protein